MKRSAIVRFVLTFWVVLLLSGQQSRADVGERPVASTSVVVMTITGRISKKTLETVRASAPKPKGDPIPAGLIVLLDSSGGDGVVAMEIGRMLRAAKAHHSAAP